MRPKSPCFECPDRVVGCHSLCDKYKEYQQANSEYVRKINAQNYNSADSFIIERCLKRRKSRQ